jgi:hypothetical protein
MQKKTVLIISLILSIFSLLYFVTEYYGCHRYVKLHLNNTDFYLKNYTKLVKAAKDRTIICFSATPEQMASMGPFLNSILDQTVRVDEIMLIIPYKNMSKVPEKFKKILSVHGHSKNYDNAANLICSVLTEPEASTKIIVVEPNMVYAQDFVENMVSNSDKNPNKIIYGGPAKDKETKYGILVKPGFFDDKISKYEEGCAEKGCCPWLDKCTNVSCVFANSGNTYKIW